MDSSMQPQRSSFIPLFLSVAGWTLLHAWLVAMEGGARAHLSAAVPGAILSLLSAARCRQEARAIASMLLLGALPATLILSGYAPIEPMMLPLAAWALWLCACCALLRDHVDSLRKTLPRINFAPSPVDRIGLSKGGSERLEGPEER